LVALTRERAGESHIMLVDPSGRSRPRDLGRGWEPSWSPDGQKLAFTYEVDTDSTYGGGVGAVLGRGEGGGLERIFVMNADGSGRRLLAMPWLRSGRFEDSAPSWSPDGRRIAFTRTIWPAGEPHTQWNPGRSAVYVLDLDHGGLRRVSDLSDGYSEFGHVTWSPDGRRLAYLAPSNRAPCPVLHVANADGTGDHLLTAASRPSGAPTDCLLIVTPAWSPDGHWIAFARVRPMKPATGGVDLYLISPDGKRLHRLTHQPNAVDIAPTWSADSKRIGFVTSRLGDPAQPPHQALAVIDRDGTHRHTILHIQASAGRGLTWQPG
jgi:Tol biopolymer transport system component